MRPTRLIPFALATALLAPGAIDAQGNDPDVAARTSNKPAPSGWEHRTDRPSTASLAFSMEGAGMRVTSGPAAVYWSGANVTKGPFTLEATFVQQRKPSHPEAYGVVWGGENLMADNQSYYYLIVLGDGKYMVKHRAGPEVHELVPWTDHEAIMKEDASGKARNALKVESTAGGVKLYANGKLLRELPPDATGDGIAGIRVNHNLDVAIEGFRVGKP